MVFLLTVPFTLLLPAVVRAANSWNAPCHTGECSYDLKNSTHAGNVRASVTISGPTSAIADLTPAAGWQILNCNATDGAQDIRAICTGSDNDCGHLYQNGAVGTVVRLPEGCGKMPFARIAAEWTHDNQTVPEDVAQGATRRAEPSTVRGITVDTQWHMINPNRHGQVNMFVQGATGNQTLPDVNAQDLHRRGLFSSITSALHALSFNLDKSSTKTIDVSKPFSLLDKTKLCPASGLVPSRKVGLTVDVNAKAHADINYGVVASGSIVPPKVKDFGIFADFDAQLGGSVDVDAFASISLDSGKLMIFQAGLPGLDFPGILTIGPSFQITAQAVAKAQADVKIAVDLAYNINGAKVYFPPGHGSSLGTFSPSNTNLQLSADPSVSATGSLQAHVIPAVLFGVNALDGLANVDVELDLDTFAELDLTLSESKSGFTGCADVKTGINVKAAANGSFFSLFNKATVISIYSKSFDLFKKCFGNAHRRRYASIEARDGPTCDGSFGTSTTKTTITSGTVPASR
ncbi:hypothetical protein BDY19DRAFT_1042228 [Irpex rosettiformis]|uniref:Uncharacterized protein n=1 Tax=Irpex rosettiformis TaxID=378272 RepID=A0ACB8U0C6_9APHY|nr:hypothetical protein BDY19DRAFT_1042228 [Irpex rosettiformis]